MKRVLYLAGPITEDPDARKSFKAASRALQSCGYRVMNPFEIRPSEFFKKYDVMTLAERELAQLKADLIVMLTCDGVATLAINYSSKGTARELALAYSLEMPVMPVAMWMKRADKGGRNEQKDKAQN